MGLELAHTKASDKYVIVNKDKKTYCIISVQYKCSEEIEYVLDMKISHRFNDMKAFKKHYKGYK